MLTKTIHALLVAGIISLPLLAGEKRFFVATDILNIRSQPTTDAAVLGYYDISRSDEIVNVKDGWVQSPKGYIKKEYAVAHEKIKVESANVGNQTIKNGVIN